MADVLALLGQLEEEESKQKAEVKQTKNTGKSKKSSKSPKNSAKDIAAQNASKNAGRRSRSQAPSNISRGSSSASVRTVDLPQSLGHSLRTTEANTEIHRGRSPGAESRRISFADPPRPGGNKIWIVTKTDSPASGFPYDPRLNKYRVSEEEWEDFNKELLEAVAVPGPSWAWTFRKKDVVKRIRRDLQFDGNVARTFKKWNRLFKQQRFQAWLELPSPKNEDSSGTETYDKVYRKRFKLVISPNKERAPSVYSRNSSMTRSVTGEGVTAAMGRKAVNDDRKSRDTTDDEEDTS